MSHQLCAFSAFPFGFALFQWHFLSLVLKGLFVHMEFMGIFFSCHCFAHKARHTKFCKSDLWKQLLLEVPYFVWGNRNNYYVNAKRLFLIQPLASAREFNQSNFVLQTLSILSTT